MCKIIYGHVHFMFMTILRLGCDSSISVLIVISTFKRPRGFTKLDHLNSSAPVRCNNLAVSPKRGSFIWTRQECFFVTQLQTNYTSHVAYNTGNGLFPSFIFNQYDNLCDINLPI